MSNPDGFIEEVTEEVRRDRLFNLFRRYGWIGILAVVLIVGGASYNEWRKAQAENAAQALGDRMLGALESDAPEARISALAEITRADEAGAVARFLAAGESTGEDQNAGLVAKLTAIADNAALPPAYRQLATLKLALSGGDTRPVDARRASITPLTEPGQPFRPVALEVLAMIEIDAGNTETALAHLQTVLRSPEASVGLRQRATQLIVALGGDPDAS